MERVIAVGAAIRSDTNLHTNMHEQIRQYYKIYYYIMNENYDLIDSINKHFGLFLFPSNEIGSESFVCLYLDM